MFRDMANDCLCGKFFYIASIFIVLLGVPTVLGYMFFNVPSIPAQAQGLTYLLCTLFLAVLTVWGFLTPIPISLLWRRER